MNNKTPPHIGTGKTEPGNTAWKPDENDEKYGICVEVDTSSAGFKTTPNYVASLGGVGDQDRLTGTSAIYHATKTSFSIYLRWSEKREITPTIANDSDWHVIWIGAE
jgi:hypothetical protein